VSYTTEDFSESLQRTAITKGDVARVIAAWGKGDGQGVDAGHYRHSEEGVTDWNGGFLMQLRDGRFAYLTGWCDAYHRAERAVSYSPFVSSEPEARPNRGGRPRGGAPLPQGSIEHRGKFSGVAPCREQEQRTMLSDLGVVLMIGGVGVMSFVVGHLFGWHAGTRDTERRWSDAVSRKRAADEGRADGQEWVAWRPGDDRC
jgi:hypothetical protein